MAQPSVLLGRSTRTPVDNTARRIVTLPGQPSVDFILTANCRIVNVGGRVSMTASDLPGQSGGTYEWSSSSTKIRLANTTGGTLAVEALTEPGTGRDSESITVTRTGANGAKQTKVVLLTVARVTFGPAATQKYGYDDFDTPLITNDDHVSIMSDGETFVAVKIEGGAVGTDFNFVFDGVRTCTASPAPAAAVFDLHVRARPWQKRMTVLSAKVKCPAQTSFAQITFHIYTELVVNVLVAKVADARSAATALRFATADYATHEAAANEKLKEAVVRFEIENFEAGNTVTNIPYDSDGTGTLTYDIAADGGAEFERIKSAFPVIENQFRVVIVRDMKSYYYVYRAVMRGARSISLRGTDVFSSSMILGTGATQEQVLVTHTSGNIAHLANPLSFDHAVGETMEFPAAAWSNDPIIISEGSTSLPVTKWTILHEVGHRALKLDDIDDPMNFMNHNQENTDNRLRLCERNKHYAPGEKENQWDTIPRPAPETRTTRSADET